MKGENGEEKVVHFGGLKDNFPNELRRRIWSEGEKEICAAVSAASLENSHLVKIYDF